MNKKLLPPPPKITFIGSPIIRNGWAYSVVKVGEEIQVTPWFDNIATRFFFWQGYDFSLLKNIGDKDPQEVITAFLASKESQTKSKVQKNE